MHLAKAGLALRKFGPRAVRRLRRGVGYARRTVAVPSPVPEGWSTGPPDFVGVGAQRAGTSWWYGLVTEHPAVEKPSAMRKRLRLRERPSASDYVPAPSEGALPKELHFFESFAGRELTSDDIALYHRFFPRPSGSLAGEWTPRYMHDFWTPALLRTAAPNARLLVLLRDPVERFRSGLAQEWRTARARGGDVSAMAWNDAVERCRYATQVRHLLEHFHADQMLVLQYERCTRDPRSALRRTFEFLGLDPEQLPANHLEVNGGRTKKPYLSPAFRESLVTALRQDIDRLGALVPDLDLELWPDFR